MHLLEDEQPSIYINSIAKAPEFQQYPFNLLRKLKDTEQSIKYHPEGNVWNHTMLVVDEAAKVRKQSKYAVAFMWEALLHDIGKPETTRNRNGKITSYNHDAKGADRAEEFLREFTQDEEVIMQVSALVRYHMHMLYVLKNLPFGSPSSMKKEVDAEEIALLCLCDRLGRTGTDLQEEEKNYKQFLDMLSNK